MAKVIGIPVPEEYQNDIRILRWYFDAQYHPKDSWHFTICYLHDAIVSRADQILSQIREQNQNYRDRDLIFDHRIYFPDKEDPSRYILGMEPDTTSKIIARELYRAGNIHELHSNRPSAIWRPHITIVRWINVLSFISALERPIILKTSDLQILDL